MKYPNLEKAIDVIAALRDPQTGCPWDLKQSHESLLKYLIEECYEFIHVVEDHNYEKMEEELGDVLLQVLLHSQIASESKKFDIDSVAKCLAEKMIERHPHVFQDPSIASNADEVTANWKKIKERTRKPKTYHIEIEDAYAPGLLAAYNIGEKSREINFDWDNVKDVLAKVEEELVEVKEEIPIGNNNQKVREEIGDLLFSVAQLARHLDINPEEALKEANLKFIKRVNKVESKVKDLGKQMNDLSTDDLELIWQEIKKEGPRN